MFRWHIFQPFNRVSSRSEIGERRCQDMNPRNLSERVFVLHNG